MTAATSPTHPPGSPPAVAETGRSGSSQRGLRDRVGNVGGLLVWAAVLAGIVVRVALWWQDRAFWRDELALVQSLDAYPLQKLLGGPLADTQSAPPGWLLLERLVSLALGTGERAYRLIPLLLGCGTLVLVALLARRFVRHTWTAAIPVLALATLSQLVFYSAQAKQYTTDTFLVTAMLVVAVGLIRGGPSRRLEIGWYALLAVGPWLSHGFMLAAPLVALWVGILQWRRGVRSPLGVLVRLAGPGLSLLLAALWARHLTSLSPAFESYWAPFMHTGDSGFLSWNHFVWEDFAIRELGFARSGALALLALPVLGVVVAFARRWSRGTAVLLVLPLVAAYLFAFAGMYPFGRRLVLFCVPGLVVALATLVDAVIGVVSRARGRWVGQAVGLVGVAGLGLCAWTTPARLDLNLRYQYGTDDYRIALRFVESRWKQGDVLVMGNGDRVAFRVYGVRLGLPEERAYRVRAVPDGTRRVGCPLPAEITSAGRIWLVTGDAVPILPDERSRNSAISPFLDRYRRVYFADKGHVSIQVLLPGPAHGVAPPPAGCLSFAPVGPAGAPGRAPALPVQ